MKRRNLYRIICVMLLISALLLTGCGKSDSGVAGQETAAEAGAEKEQKAVEEEPEETKEEEEPEEPEEERYASLEEYYKSPEGQEEWENTEKSLSENGIEIEVSENTLIYSSKIDSINMTDFDEEQKQSMLDAMEETMQENMERQEDDLQSTFEQLKEETGIEGIVMKYLFYDAEDELIYSYEYPKK